MWMVHALLAGFGIGVGNYLIARISGQGIIALSYVGMVACFMLIVYRLIQALIIKKEHGSFINY
jgi:hypothetical protein